MAKRLVLGITGGLGSGKTTVAMILAEKGAVHIDADKIGHELLEKDMEVVREIKEQFGEEVLIAGKIDRGKLAGKVFSDGGNMERLCEITHPRIARAIKEKVNAIDEGVIVVDAPLLIEAGLGAIVDRVILVKASDEIKIARAVGRGMSKEEALRRLALQMPDEEKERSADIIIENSKDMVELRKGVDEIWQRI
ncbi:MAG: dephospho-CoA kinase [Candidatus Omnitrophica bacterium]|nr:dephospho-CoA kinase [Candidatus Omnitrophota bacterium]MDD5488630.1 dephospho-CoA kinase [Candidatus Omnitrophota bacterium]